MLRVFYHKIALFRPRFFVVGRAAISIFFYVFDASFQPTGVPACNADKAIQAVAAVVVDATILPLLLARLRPAGVGNEIASTITALAPRVEEAAGVSPEPTLLQALLRLYCDGEVALAFMTKSIPRPGSGGVDARLVVQIVRVVGCLEATAVMHDNRIGRLRVE